MKLLDVPLKQSNANYDVGSFLKMNENGWIEEKADLNMISPSSVLIENFLEDKKINVINCRKEMQNMPQFTKSYEKKGPHQRGAFARSTTFRAKNAVQKLRSEKRPDLAAYSIALDSNREI